MKQVYYEECHSCPHRMTNLVAECDKKQKWTRVKVRYTTIYLLFQNDKDIIRPYYGCSRRIIEVHCPKLLTIDDEAMETWNGEGEQPTKPFPIDTIWLTRKQLLAETLRALLTTTYKEGGRKVIRVVDVSRCLNKIEKWQLRQDFQYNKGVKGKKRWIYATRWWKQYQETAKVVYIDNGENSERIFWK